MELKWHWQSKLPAYNLVSKFHVYEIPLYEFISFWTEKSLKRVSLPKLWNWKKIAHQRVIKPISMVCLWIIALCWLACYPCGRNNNKFIPRQKKRKLKLFDHSYIILYTIQTWNLSWPHLYLNDCDGFLTSHHDWWHLFQLSKNVEDDNIPLRRPCLASMQLYTHQMKNRDRERKRERNQIYILKSKYAKFR